MSQNVFPFAMRGREHIGRDGHLILRFRGEGQVQPEGGLVVVPVIIIIRDGDFRLETDLFQQLLVPDGIGKTELEGNGGALFPFDICPQEFKFPDSIELEYPVLFHPQRPLLAGKSRFYFHKIGVGDFQRFIRGEEEDFFRTSFKIPLFKLF